MNIRLLDQINIPNLLKESGLKEYEIYGDSIGNDDGIHILLAKAIPFQTNTHYQAASLIVDWKNGGLLGFSLTDFGVLAQDLCFIQRLGDGFLLVGAHAYKHKDDNVDCNVLITDSMGNVYTKHCFGDGIRQCLVDSQNRIITAYSDMGVFGSHGWSQPIGTCGLIVWSAEGVQLWSNKNHNISDCYAINFDEHDHLWFYYYTEFNLVQTDYQNETIYMPHIGYSQAFLLDIRRQRILFAAGNQRGNFIFKKLDEDSMTEEEQAAFVWNGNTLVPRWFSFCSSKALLWDKENNLYYTDWANIN